VKLASLVLAFILILVPFSAASAQGSITIKITMHTPAPKMLAVGLTSSQTEWNIGDIEPNQTKKTAPEKTWCTITNTGNCSANLSIKGENAVDIANPSYEWVLSDDGTNGKERYALWFWIARNSTDYTPITTSERPFYNKSLEAGGEKQFGLKLLAPTEFEPGRSMETHITISAVCS
jgi:hypothetical protein